MFSISSKYFKFLKSYMFDLVVTIWSPVLSKKTTSLLDTYIYVVHYFEQFKLPGSGFILEFCERCANISVGQ